MVFASNDPGFAKKAKDPGFAKKASRFSYRHPYRRSKIRRLLPLGSVQTHHVIPKAVCKKLPFFDSECKENLVLMPTIEGLKMLALNESRSVYVHDGGHPKYNTYVGELTANATSVACIILIISRLKAALRKGSPGVPWL